MRTFLFLILLMAASMGFAQVKEDRFILSQIRGEIVPPTYTESERQTLIEQSLLIFKEWNVHELVKNQVHGNQQANAVLIEEIQSQGPTLPIDELLTKISQLYKSQFDDHLNFYMPKPMACYASEIPLRFNLAQNSGDNRFFVSALKDYRILNSDGTEASIPGFNQIEIGDELMTYDGMTSDALISLLQEQKQLSRAHARPRWARNYMIWRNHLATSVPSADTVHFKFKKISGQEYEISFPWLVRKTTSCLQSTSSMEDQESPDWNLGSVSSVEEIKILSDRNETSIPVEYVMPVDSKLGYGWGYYRKGGEKFGYFRLENFSPSVYVNNVPVKDHHLLMLQFQRFFRILNNDPSVKGLILDVRDNPGGSLLLSAAMVQSFTKNTIMATRYRWKATASTARFLDFSLNGKGNEHVRTQALAVQQAFSQGLPFSNPNPLYDTDDLLAKQYPQVFFKPVTVLTNTSCYSSCDNFAALMQDHAAARIIGEDVATGGGGANVWDYSSLVKEYSPLPPELRIRPLPYGQNIRWPVRQIVRLGDPNKLVEDIGVLSDEIVKVSREEIIKQNSPLFERAADYILSQNDGVHRPVQSEPQTIWYDVLEGPTKLNLRSAIVWDQSISKGQYAISENEYLVQSANPGEFSTGAHQRLVIGLARKDVSLQKVRFQLKLKSEACCDRVLVGVRTVEGGERWLAAYAGEFDEIKELHLGLGPSEKFELIFTTSTDFAANKGRISVSDVEIF